MFEEMAKLRFGTQGLSARPLEVAQLGPRTLRSFVGRVHQKEGSAVSCLAVIV